MELPKVGEIVIHEVSGQKVAAIVSHYQSFEMKEDGTPRNPWNVTIHTMSVKLEYDEKGKPVREERPVLLVFGPGETWKTVI